MIAIPPASLDPAAALERVMVHAAHHNPYYRDQPWAARLRRGLPVAPGDLPITPKEAVRDDTAAFYSEQVPAEDGQVLIRETSGSTGIPLLIRKTQRHFAINDAANQRLKQGWGFETHRGQVSATNPPAPERLGDVEEWRTPDSTTWTIYSFNGREVGALLLKTRATLLTTRPNVVKGALLDYPEIDFLRLINTVSESIPPELPQLIARMPGCLHFDLYGAVETGAIAGLCRTCGNYHIAFRQVRLELLDDMGNPVAPGDMGRVVVTTLHNLAMPLIRYDIGDFAIRAERDACDGSGLALKTIVGRRRDLFKLPDGSKILPYPLPDTMLPLPILQYKLVQTSLSDVEVHYVPREGGAPLSQETAQAIVSYSVSPLLKAIPVMVDALPVRANEKYVMHQSLV